VTIIDDDSLSALFAQTAEAFPAPESGAADILARALGTPPAAGGDGRDGAGPGAVDGADGADGAGTPAPRWRSGSRRVRTLAGTHRIMSAAAVLVLVLVIAGGATALDRSPAAKTPRSATTLGTAALGGSAAHHLATSGAGSAAGTTTPAFAATGGVAAAAPTPAGTTNGTLVPSTGTTGATGAASTVPGVGQSSRIEQTGSLTLMVAKGALTRTMTELTFLAGAYNGFVSTSQTRSGAEATSGVPSGTITIEVPEDSFTAVLKKAQALGTTESVTTKATDVTGQYVDLQSRITALQDSRQQYLTIMAKATSIGDVLSVQEQLDSIQSQIEQLQGQLQLLSSQTTYSALSITASERAPVHHHHHTVPTHRSGLATAWHNSVHGFVSGVEGLIRLAGPALFVLLCGLVLVFGGRAGWRRYQRHGL
jgi:hypothetical protein